MPRTTKADLRQIAVSSKKQGAKSPGKKSPRNKSAQRRRGVLLEDLTWIEAEKVLTADTVVVIPLGAQSKEHGPHLPLKNDFLLAEYLKRRVLAAADVVVAPTVNYGYYPAFTEYPGSTTLASDTQRDMIVQIAASLCSYGPKRVYVLNTGFSTRGPLRQSAAILKERGIILTYTDPERFLAPVEKRICKQEGGTHADEVETSMMLYMVPEIVDMSKAVKDFHPGSGPLTRIPGTTSGTYSPTGVWGDATLATRSKGRALTEALVHGICTEIEELKKQAAPMTK